MSAPRPRVKTYYSAIPVDPSGSPVDFRYAAREVADRLWETTALLDVDRDLTTFKIEYVPEGAPGPESPLGHLAGRIVASVQGVRR